MHRQKYNPHTADYLPGRHQIIVEEVKAGKFIVKDVDTEEDESTTNELNYFRDQKIEMDGNTIEALRNAYQFRSVKFQKSETLKPKKSFNYELIYFQSTRRQFGRPNFQK
jgi:hypothetical protein